MQQLSDAMGEPSQVDALAESLQSLSVNESVAVASAACPECGFVLPACWADDDAMSFLFSRLRPHDAADVERKVAFWAAVMRAVQRHRQHDGGERAFTLHDMRHRLTRVRPAQKTAASNPLSRCCCCCRMSR